MATSPSKNPIEDHLKGHRNLEQTGSQWDENSASKVAHEYNQNQSHHGLPQSVKQDKDSGYPKGPTFENDNPVNEGANAKGVYQHQNSTKSKLPADFIDTAVIFFVALVQILYYWGTLQWFIQKFAVFFFWSMRVSGGEAIVASASPFIGQGESAMLIKPFVAHLTQAELHQVMCSGFATIAGSVLVAYIALGVNGQALVSSCVMSIPASLAISKLRYPETEQTLTSGRCVVPDDEEHRASNTLHAFANGAWLGLKIAGMILSTLLCIIALLGLADGLLTWWGRYLNINDPPLTVELIVGYICYPIAFLLGVPRNGDLLKVGQLIGTKLIAVCLQSSPGTFRSGRAITDEIYQNEFVAYTALQTDPSYADLSPRSRLIATYALCGFANIGSLGTQIGVLSQIAPSRSGDVSRLAFSALIAGALSTLTSASIAGLLVTDQAAYFSPGPTSG
ncbi:MAG: hypothetical protein LQ351_001084 [Letrouitia transgressa]|nr:MAG: hypothetical protein LQ351_001084 [Letrouitia transgressa]